MRKVILFVATGAGTGYAPVAPGTVGSLLGLGLYAGLVLWLPPPAAALGLPIAVVLLAALGVWAAGRAEALLGRKDDPRITVDEVSGVLLSLLFLPVRLDRGPELGPYQTY